MSNGTNKRNQKTRKEKNLINVYHLSLEMETASDRYKIYRDPNLLQGKFYIFCGLKYVWKNKIKMSFLQCAALSAWFRDRLFKKRAEN